LPDIYESEEDALVVINTNYAIEAGLDPQPDTLSKEEDDSDLEIVRTKRLSLKPMDSEEAVLQMNMLGHNFFIFEDAETNGTSIVYRRKDGKYGLIETD